MWMLIIVVLGVFFSLQSEAMVGMVVGHRDNEPHPVHGRNEAAAELAGEVDPGLVVRSAAGLLQPCSRR